MINVGAGQPRPDVAEPAAQAAPPRPGTARATYPDVVRGSSGPARPATPRTGTVTAA
ncbi:hypothetical protein GCM10023334_002400 [Nonomuraea thailandensis]